MPIYEYRCLGCGEVSSFFTRSISAALEPVCGHCQSRDMQRRMSSFALGKPTASAHGQFPPGPGAGSPDYYSDPRNIGRNVEQGFARYGTNMPDSIRETIDSAREGNLPKVLDL